MLEIYFRYFLC